MHGWLHVIRTHLIKGMVMELETYTHQGIMGNVYLSVKLYL